jgi:HrpA-like RNA helicase
MDSDFAFALLILTVQRRATTRRPLRLIVMSATISTDKFALYMGEHLIHDGSPAPVLAIPGYTFPVIDYFKHQYEDIVRYHYHHHLTSYIERYDSPLLVCYMYVDLLLVTYLGIGVQIQMTIIMIVVEVVVMRFVLEAENEREMLIWTYSSGVKGCEIDPLS